jgi:hypothetical protein
MTRSTFGAACAAVLFLLPGCGKPPPPEIVPVEGVVLLGGKPLPNAQVTFTPTGADLGYEYVAVGTTDDKGRFKMTCKGQPGACACTNRVTVVEASLPETARGMSGEAQAAAARYYAGLKNRPIPELYATVASSPLSVDVAAGKTEYKLELLR